MKDPCGTDGSAAGEPDRGTADAKRLAVAQFAGLDPRDMALAGGGGYDRAAGVITLRYCGLQVAVGHPGADIAAPGTLSHAEGVIILQYLAARGALPPRERWLSFLELPGGPHHHDLFVAEAIAPLADRFGPDPGALQPAAAALGGSPLRLGHAGALIPALPRLPLAVVVWRGDEEFPPRASLLFDAVAPHYLTTAALFVLGIEIAARLRRAAPPAAPPGV